MGVRMKNVGFQEYHGMDGNTVIHVAPKEVVTVSEEKAEQLMNDYGPNWERVDKAKPAAGDSSKSTTTTP